MDRQTEIEIVVEALERREGGVIDILEELDGMKDDLTRYDENSLDKVSTEKLRSKLDSILSLEGDLCSLATNLLELYDELGMFLKETFDERFKVINTAFSSKMTADELEYKLNMGSVFTGLNYYDYFIDDVVD